MPCSAPVTSNIPSGGNASAIQGFGVPFAPPSPSNPPTLPSNQPEDLNSIFNAIQFIVPSGSIKPHISSNYDKTVFDAIMKVMEAFAPFLMLYKMILPLLRIIICIIECICAIPNPFKLIEKIQQLFRVCIPEFLAIFPQFALIVIILSILNLLISLIEYIITEVANLVAIIQKNIDVIKRSLTVADDRSILAATEKIGAVLCAFQNLFVLFSVFDTIVSVIQVIIKLLFPIPPCADNNGNDIQCCTPDVCPDFIKNNTDINRSTGSLQYYNEVGTSFLGLPFISDERNESWQFYDTDASIQLALINITNAYDLPDGYTAVFFPTDSTYTASTPPTQAPYLVNLRLFYNPTVWNGTGTARYIRINNCIVTAAPTANLSSYNNSNISIANGVVKLAGGVAYEDDNTTPILVNGVQGSLNTLIHLPANINIIPPPLNPTDGYLFSDITYDFIIQHPVLLGKALITLGCVPNVGLDRNFIATVFTNTNFNFLNNLTLPDVGGAQLCLSTAISALQASVTDESLATFQASTTACLSNLQDQTNIALTSVINAGVDPYKSTFSIDPATQFTTENIKVSVQLLENNGLNLATNLSASMGADIAKNIQATITFGQITAFTYDGYSLFNAELSADTAGTGTIQIAYQNQIISTISLPTNLNQAPSVTPVVKDYNFIYSTFANPKTSVGDTEGSPRFDNFDISRGGS